jgi:serine/threonine protein phosphatase PrpC
MAEQQEITAKLDQETLADGWAKLKDRKPQMLLDVHIGAQTDLGRVRENNEDKYAFHEPEELDVLAVKGLLYAVADGMGGHASGQIASEMALKTLLHTYFCDPSEDVPESLMSALRMANSYIFDAGRMIPEREGMGTTCTCLVLRDDTAYIGQVGDSRCYLIRNGELRQITEDHSWVAEQVRRGLFSREEAEMSPFRNVITRSLGAAPDVEPDVFQEQVEKDDVFVLCSDGLSGYVSDEEIRETASASSPALAAMKLVDRANENGGGDNVTVLIVAIRDIQKAGKQSRLKRLFGR